MFMTEQAVENWKNDLRQKQTLLESDIEELESHLHEEMERLTPLGLSEEEAFVIATRRIGDTTQIASEFAKVNAAAIWKNRFFWMIAGILTSRFLLDLSYFLGNLCVVMCAKFQLLDCLHAGILGGIINGLAVITLPLVFYILITKTTFYRRLWEQNKVKLFFVLWLIVGMGGKIVNFVQMVFLARIIEPKQFGQLAIGTRYSSMVIGLLFPLILVCLLFLLLPKKTQTT